MAASSDPSNPSSAYASMSPVWQKIDDIIAGPETIRAGGQSYLPKYEAEEDGEYGRRLAAAPWRPEFVDILQSLSSKPFGKDVALKQGASAPIKALAENIDARGNNLTAFARQVFAKGIAKGMHGVLVEYPKQPTGQTLADERQSGARPYWVSIRAEEVLALYTAFVQGREVAVHVRLSESAIERSGFDEVTVQRIRILNRDPVEADNQIVGFGPPTWQLWEKRGTGEGSSWAMVDEGAYFPQTEIPLVLFWTGERDGAQFARPPLEAIADMQLELYRALSRKDEVLTYTASPMLQAKGIAPPDGGALEIGPKRVLFAPPGVDGAETGWSYIQPDAQNLTEIREDVRDLIDDIRRLGMQPLTQKAGNVTATASSIEGAKAHSVVEAWALGLKDALEQALVYTARWLGEASAAEIEIDTDFSVEPYAQAPLDALAKARENGDLSQGTYWQSLRRFDVLPPDFDPEAEVKALLQELPGEDTATDLRDALGRQGDDTVPAEDDTMEAAA